VIPPPLAALLAVAAFAACGPNGSDSIPGPSTADPRAAPAVAAVKAYFDAVRAADGRAICSRIAPRPRRDIERLQSQPCQEALAAEARRLPESLAGYHVLSAEVSGRTARVVVEGRGQFRDELRLERAGGRWLITSAPGLGG
jgi:hypothetical protein